VSCKPVIAWIAGLSCVAVIAAQPGEAPFRPLAKSHRWFELRSTASAKTSPLVRGALAAAFNDPATAERLLRGVIRDEPRSANADDAFALLAYLYLRTGQYERFATLYQAWAAAFPQSATVREERENFEKYRGRPNQSNGPRRHSVVRHDGDGYPTLPISVDGKTDDFIFDTGAFQSAVTESEAKKLGMAVQDDPRTLIDVSGTRTAFRTAVAKEVTLGSMTFRNVSFAVITPGGAFADAEIGIIGVADCPGHGWDRLVEQRHSRIWRAISCVERGAESRLRSQSDRPSRRGPWQGGSCGVGYRRQQLRSERQLCRTVSRRSGVGQERIGGFDRRRRHSDFRVGGTAGTDLHDRIQIGSAAPSGHHDAAKRHCRRRVLHRERRPRLAQAGAGVRAQLVDDDSTAALRTEST
jgi:predicted aspartyl protease